MKKITLFLLIVVLAGTVFAFTHSALADGPEFMPPSCTQGNSEKVNGVWIDHPTCGYYTVDRTINLTPALTNSFVFIYLPVGIAGSGPFNYTVLDTGSWDALNPLSFDTNIVPLTTQAIPKSYFESNGGMDGLLTENVLVPATLNTYGSPICPDGYALEYGRTCKKVAPIKPAVQSHIFNLYVVAVNKDRYDLPDSPRTTVKAGTLIPWSKGDADPFVQTELGNPLTEKRLIYAPLGIIGNKIILYRSQEVYYINQGTAKTVSRTVDLPIPTVPGIQPIPGTVLAIASSSTSTPQIATTTATTGSSTTGQEVIHPIVPNSPSFADFIGSFFSGFGKFLQSLFRF